MKKIFAAALAGTMFLASCSGGGEEETTEEATEETLEEATGEESTVEESGEATEESSGSTSSGESEEASTEENIDTAAASTDDKPKDLTEAEIDEPGLDFGYDIDEDKVSMVENATETDQSVEDVLRNSSEVTSYVQDTSIIIEISQGEQIVDQSFQGIVAEVDESNGLEVASDYFNENFEIIQPHGYGNSETGELFMFTEAGWTDYSPQYEAKDIIYGLYSNIYDIIQQMPDALQVLEEGDYDILYYTGNDERVYQLYQNNFEMEFSGANMDELQMGFVAFINKTSGDLESVNLIATAPGLEAPEQSLTIEVILNYHEYGLFDDGAEIKKPHPDELGGAATEEETAEESRE
ncbi:hypothetical protein [Salinicoccus sp. HZC-1]|uniref:hypothetical protein n=1 Tax=Salinicoccus sp. HZC-1 TaxID=3385497 RepID=UPI00398B380B